MTGDIAWPHVVKRGRAATLGMTEGRMVILEYVRPEPGGFGGPFAQAAPTESGNWYLDLCSHEVLPRAAWCLDTNWLRRNGWRDPFLGGPINFHRFAPEEAVAELLVYALRDGRGCDIPQRFVWRTGRFACSHRPWHLS